MGIIAAVVPLLIMVVVFFFVVRIATIVLKLTGMDEKTSRFQTISAFTGTGFTTKEAETILEDRIRRKTIIFLMVLGKVGIVSVMISLFLSFGKDNLEADLWKTVILFVFILIFYKTTTLRGFSRALNKFIEKRIVARGIIRQKTLEELFYLPKGYGLTQLAITKDSKEIGLSLADAGFIKKGILILSIERKDQLIALPQAHDQILEGDKLLCYGIIENMKAYA